MILIISPKDAYITNRLLDEAAKIEAPVETLSIQELAERRFEVDVKRYDTLYVRSSYPYFPQVVNLAQQFIAAGKKVVDADIARGDIGLGKMPVYQKLSKANICIPKTQWFLKATEWGYPCILKWTYGFGGKEVFLVKDPEGLRKASELIPQEELLLQEFIAAEYEYKVITVGYKSLPVVLRFEINRQNWRPDFGRHDVLQTAHVNPEIINLAEQSSVLLKRELAKTDILQKGDTFYVLEVNRWPGLKSFEELTGYNVVADFIKYLK